MRVLNVVRNYSWIRPVFMILGLIGLVIILSELLFALPKPLFKQDYATVICDHEGKLLGAKLAQDEQWRFPPADTIAFKFRTAIRVYEDEYFNYHPGVNPVSIIRASLQNIKAGKVVSGGSTITMQVVRMALGNPKRTFPQKLYEIVLALKLDLSYSKQEILAQYVYHAPFGGNVVGLSAASWRYFGRPAGQLSWAEVAALAVLPNDPSSIFPGKNETDFLVKRNFLIDKLYRKGYIDHEQSFLAKEEPLPGKVKPLPNLAYHLLQRIEAEHEEANLVHTTLDYQLQYHTREKVHLYSQKMAANGIHNAAAIIIDITTGNTLAYVGNVDGSDGNHGQYVDIISSKRSPGSILKPILYASALDEGILLPKELLPDIPLVYRGFAPKNFDKKFRGAVPADKALTSSLNVPFVFLLKEYGYEKFHHKLIQMGLTSLNKPPGHYGLSLILGGAETSLWDVTAMYAGLARSLLFFNANPLNDTQGNNYYHPNSYDLYKVDKSKTKTNHKRILEPSSIYYTFLALQELRRPEEQTGWELFGSARQIAWKTGTSYGFRDAWAIGLNSKYLVGIWIGNADGEGRPGLTGIRAAAPLMFDIFSLLDGDAIFENPYNKEEPICKISGLRATEFCTDTIMMTLPQMMLEGKLCTYHKNLHLSKDSVSQVNSSCYPISSMKEVSWFVLPAVQSWYYKQYHPNYNEPPPFLRGCTPDNSSGVMELIYPRQFTKVFVPVEQDGNPGLAVFEVAHREINTTIYWHLDSEYLGSTNHFHQMGIRPQKGQHVLTLVDEKGNELQTKFEVINE